MNLDIEVQPTRVNKAFAMAGSNDIKRFDNMVKENKMRKYNMPESLMKDKSVALPSVDSGILPKLKYHKKEKSQVVQPISYYQTKEDVDDDNLRAVHSSHTLSSDKTKIEKK